MISLFPIHRNLYSFVNRDAIYTSTTVKIIYRVIYKLCHLSSGAIERVSTFKLLGIHLDINLVRTHYNSITPKASKRLYFLKQLKSAGVPYKQLLHFYTAVIRPVLEYAAPAWHHLINNRTQAQHMESVQTRAIHIIFNFTRGMSYPNVLFVAQLESLATFQDPFFKIFANQPPVFIISFHLPEMPPL